MRPNYVAFLIPGFVAQLAHAALYSCSIMFPLITGSTNPIFSTGVYQVIAGQAVGLRGNDAADTQKGAIWTPAGVTLLGADVYATDGPVQVGDQQQATMKDFDAMVWTGTAASGVDLTPTDLSGFTNTTAHGIGGTEIVGYGGGSATDGPYAYDALLWSNGTPQSAVNLNPTQLGFTASQAIATDGNYQVGIAAPQYGDLTSVDSQAMLWHGSAQSAINLTPANCIGATALGVADGQEVGQCYTIHLNQDAVLWEGSASTAVDLSPTDLTGFDITEALATNGMQQVGDGYTSSDLLQALAWSGTANSAVDLQNFLPASGTWTNSSADSIDSSGNIFGYVDGTFDGTTGQFAVEWTPLPEPSSAALLLAPAILALRRRKNPQQRH